jgi:uncharacterized repeat protein (TIGR01451 family)
MRRGALGVVVLAAALLFVFSGVASADVTLGTTSPPAGSSPGACFTGSTGQPDVIAQATDSPSASYTVPASGGSITSWSTNVSLDEPGTSLTMVVLTPHSDGTYTVVAADTETIPSPLPSSGVATFTLATPIRASAGDKLAIYTSDAATTPVLCFFDGPNIPAANTLVALFSPTSPSSGQTLSPDGVGATSPPSFELDLSATLVQSADVSLTKVASVSSVNVGGQITYTIKAANAGPDSAVATTVSDPLPADVSLVSASASAGSCSGASTVSCSLGTLASGGSATVTIVVKAVTAGTATNTATVSSSTPDSNMANNSATATTTIVTPPPPPLPPAKHKLKLSVSPHSARAGQQRCYGFTATSSGKGVKGVTVKFAGHSGHTSGKGKVQICVKLKRGSYRASATKSAYVTAHATVVVKPAKAKKKAPSFTG